MISNITLTNHKELFSFHFHFTLERLNHAQIHTKQWGIFTPQTQLNVQKPKTRQILWVHTTLPFMLNNVTNIAITCMKLVIWPFFCYCCCWVIIMDLNPKFSQIWKIEHALNMYKSALTICGHPFDTGIISWKLGAGATTWGWVWAFGPWRPKSKGKHQKKKERRGGSRETTTATGQSGLVSLPPTGGVT